MILETIRSRILERRRSSTGTPETIAVYAINFTDGGRLTADELRLTLPERVALNRLQADLDAKRIARRERKEAEKARQEKWRRSLPPAPPNLGMSSLGATGVREALGCSLTELNRWAADGRLPPDGQRWFYLGYEYAGRRGVWGRAWLPETVGKAAEQVAAWREQDAIRKTVKRRGLRMVAA
jgi:hypothetical protein